MSNVESIRINKYLSQIGYCSRRQADKLLEDGKITIDGKVATLGEGVCTNSVVAVNGKIVSRASNHKNVLIAFNKPRGIVCTTSKIDKDNIVDYINYPTRIYPIGRLDKASTGLILLTNNGDIVNKILKGSNMHEKEYEVSVDKPITEEFINGMMKGVPILDTVTRPCILKKTGECSFNIIITQGLNRQIRRMCEYFGYRVMKLNRVRIINIKLGNLKVGHYRELTIDEEKKLMSIIDK